MSSELDLTSELSSVWLTLNASMQEDNVSKDSDVQKEMRRECFKNKDHCIGQGFQVSRSGHSSELEEVTAKTDDDCFFSFFDTFFPLLLEIELDDEQSLSFDVFF